VPVIPARRATRVGGRRCRAALLEAVPGPFATLVRIAATYLHPGAGDLESLQALTGCEGDEWVCYASPTMIARRHLTREGRNAAYEIRLILEFQSDFQASISP